eukprot:GDKI01025481.1.p1 GENE.GDKI01025481.1~~GDKI01025481.1.p1  ORF type:complete len:317 (-),score=92.34 GDKI01025481.1:215-1165(-)
MTTHYPNTTPPPAECLPPTIAAASVRAGAILQGTNGSLWIAMPKKGVLRPLVENDTPPENAHTHGSGSQMDVGQGGEGEEEREEGEEEGDECPNIVAGKGDTWMLYTADANEKETLYWTHDNGGRPFLLRVTPRVFAVYRKGDKREMQEMKGEDRTMEHIAYADQNYSCLGRQVSARHPSKYTLLACDPHAYKRIFIGDYETKNTHPDFGIGNSCLVEIQDRKWMWVGDQVLAFTTPDHIHAFHSPIGNNDVPYPYAMGDQYTYFLIENGKLPTSKLSGCTHHPDLHAYSVWYERERDREMESVCDMKFRVVCGTQ